jgi:hypothetical protein
LTGLVNTGYTGKGSPDSKRRMNPLRMDGASIEEEGEVMALAQAGKIKHSVKRVRFRGASVR